MAWRGGDKRGVTDGGGLPTAPPARPHLVPVTEVEQVGHDGLQRQPGSLPPHHPSGGQLWGGGAVLCALSPQARGCCYSRRCSCSRCWWPGRPSPLPSCGSAAGARGAGEGRVRALGARGGHGDLALGWGGSETLTSFTTYFSRFSSVFSFRQPCRGERVVRVRRGARIQTFFVPPTPPFQKTSGGEAMVMVSPEPCPWHPPRDGLGPWPRARPGTCCGRT